MTFSGQVMNGARQVADEGDQLFVLAVTGVSGGLERAAEGLAAIGQRVPLDELGKRLGLRGTQTTRDRVRELLALEAKRAPVELAPEQLDEFAEKMGILFELIFSGVIRIEDIVLEADESAAPDPIADEGAASVGGSE